MAEHPHRVARRPSFGRVEAMEWAENNGIDYIFGLAGNTVLDALVAETADNLRFYHAKSSRAKLRTFASFTYQAGSWHTATQSGGSARRSRTSTVHRRSFGWSSPRVARTAMSCCRPKRSTCCACFLAPSAASWASAPTADRAWAGDVACCGLNHRGVALWKDEVISIALDGRMFAIDKATG